jgi:hypothetical protein
MHRTARMDAIQPTRATSTGTPYARLGEICARAGLDLQRVDRSILVRMRLLAATTETVRDCERCTDLAEAFFHYDDAVKPPEERFTTLERRTVVIGTLFSDIGKSGPEHADARGQQLVAEMYAIESVIDDQMPVTRFFDMYFPSDSSERARSFRALGLDPDMSMREFWNLHSVWTLQILRGDGVPPGAVIAAAAHHLLENINALAIIADDVRLMKYVGEDALFARPEKLVVLLDKYDAVRRRGKRSHDGAIAWLRQLIANHPRFCDDREFFELIESLDAVVKHGTTALPALATRRSTH